MRDEEHRNAQREGGREGARRRWAGHAAKTIRLDDLGEHDRRLISALIEAARENRAGAER